MKEARGDRRRLERPIRFVRQRFSPEGYLGLHLTVGLVVMLLGAWCFSEIAEGLAEATGMIAFDERVKDWFYNHSRGDFMAMAKVATWFGSVLFLTIASFGLTLLLAQRRAWDWLLALALTMLGGSLLNIVLKHFFQRQRPVLENPLVTLTSYGFPSGHTMGTTLFFGLLALFALHSLRSKRVRVAALFACMLIIATIGLTRISLGAHYLSDVLAAIAAGSAWLSFSWTTAETFRRRREQANREGETTAPG